MKVAVILLFFITAEIYGESLIDWRKSCMSETNVTAEMLKAFRKTLQKQPLEPTTDEATLCYFKCVFEKRGFIDKDDGTIDVDSIKSTVEITKGFSEEQSVKVYGCLQGLGNVTTCADVLSMEECFAKSTV